MIEVFEERARKSGNRGSYNELTKYLYKVGSSPIMNVSYLTVLELHTQVTVVK